MSQAARKNSDKLRWDLLDYHSIEELLRVLEFGAEKYAPNNWKKGLHREELLESAMRHLVLMFQGKEVDSDSARPHAAHVMCNMMFYLYMLRYNKFAKDRVNPFTHPDEQR
jgi:hypothetical protein